MNRVDFMNQLERLLQSIAPAERDEALQYYNDYFDDAGKENEQEVIEALGNPARVAENIKRDLTGSGYGGGPIPKAEASDRALVEYGKEPETGEETSGFEQIQSVFGRTIEENSADTAIYSPWEQQGDKYNRQDGGEKPVKKAGMPAWAVALLITLLILASPGLLGLAGALFGIVVCWYALVLCVGVVAVSLFVVLVILVITGVMCCFVNPWVGMALVGGGLVCGGIGLFFLMLTVAMAGLVTPAFWRSIGRLFKRKHAGA